MFQLREPVRGQVVANSFFLGLFQDQGADDGELVSHADVVDETGDLVVVLAPLDLAGRQVGQNRQGVEVDYEADIANYG